MERPRILVADSDPVGRGICRRVLGEAGMDIAEAEAGPAVVDMISRRRFDTAVLDAQIPRCFGGDILECLRRHDRELAVVILTTGSDLGDALRMIHDGAYGYLPKPVGERELVDLVRLSVTHCRTRRGKAAPAESDGAGALAAVMGNGRAIQKLTDEVARVAPTTLSVLIVGETGCGKELVARAMHARSDRAAAPFVVADCGAIAETLIGNEFFGHEKGAFTGADARQLGRFELASRGGTLFLDEVGNLPAAGQKHLLRVLEEKIIYRIGGTTGIRLDARLVAATNEDLERQIQGGGFRSDLYFRLAEYMIRVPPLRTRPEDIEYLAKRFLTQASAEFGLEVRGFSASAFGLLRRYAWPGNVRELRNLVRRAVLMAHSVIDGDDIAGFLAPAAVAPGGECAEAPASLRQMVSRTVSQVEHAAIIAALESTHGNKAAAARMLGIDYKTLQVKLRSYGRQSIGHDHAGV